MMIEKNNLTEVEESKTTAMATIDANSSHDSIPINSSIWPFARDCYCKEDQDEIVIVRN